MKFIVDAQLPKSLSDFLKSKGHDSVHTIELPAKNKTADNEVLKIALDESRIVISKDSDFLEMHLVNNKPEKLLLIRTGNISNPELLLIFEKYLERVCELIQSNSLLEINKTVIVVHG